MNTLASNTIFQQLTGLIVSAEQEGFEQERLDLTNLYRRCENRMEEDSAFFLATLLLSTYINSRGGKLSNENIYMKNYEVSQIQLFDILIDKLPYVKYSQSITNMEIVRLLSACKEATLLDIGIGLGTQVCNILAKAKNLTKLEKLVIVGIEPSPEALLKATQAIAAMQTILPFEVEFRAIEGFAEHMDLYAIDYGTENIIINASLALHHIQTDACRFRVLAQLKALNPLGLFLIEPNVNHFEPELKNRLNHCIQHFYHLFKTIDGLDISQNEKSGLKLFFGREIEDIIGKPEANRYEKHEPANAWLHRLRHLNYEVKSHLLQSPVTHEAGVEIAHHPEGFLGFTHGRETVLSVIYAA